MVLFSYGRRKQALTLDANGWLGISWALQRLRSEFVGVNPKIEAYFSHSILSFATGNHINLSRAGSDL